MICRCGKAICRSFAGGASKLKQLSWNSRGTTRTSLFFSLLSALCPPAQSPIEKRGVCLQICWYSRWYSFILVIGFFILFCFRRCDNSATGNHDVPHTTNSSSVSYTNLYCSCTNKRVYRDISYQNYQNVRLIIEINWRASNRKNIRKIINEKIF